MSYSAFNGLQRENILCFDDLQAVDYYMDIFETFRERCADHIALDTVQKVVAEPENLENNIEEVPIIKTIEKKQIVVLEDKGPECAEEAEIVLSVKGLERELKPMLPKIKKFVCDLRKNKSAQISIVFWLTWIVLIAFMVIIFRAKKIILLPNGRIDSFLFLLKILFY